jgi:hypothetical protein
VSWAQDRKPRGQSSRNRKCMGLGPNEASILGKVLGGKSPGVKLQIPVGTSHGCITWGVPRGCSLWKWPSPMGGEALKDSSGPPEAWII